MRTVAAAAPSGLLRLLTGTPRPVAVVAALPVALHLSVVGADAGTPPAICLALPGAVRLPSALVVGAGWGSVPLGTAGTVGAGRLELPALTVRVARWWRTPRPALAFAPTALAPPVLEPPFATLAADLAAALATAGLPARAVRALLGRGPGLTPLGDDILAGALVTLRALGHHRAATALARPVLAAPPAATTAVSAALLWHAARGECVPQLAALFRALELGHGVGAARDGVLRLGHSSGAGLLNGVAVGLRVGLGAATRPSEESA